ncbi:unnamed protein product [Adineta ricciae]|uniref:Poly [ADP-ribose] polymerase n=2 Tax=Adineta ricciae TaxID=249248 RepID=A0A814NGJ1_ADIRI|nr:unnamed protein product [Adineta ricciae]
MLSRADYQVYGTAVFAAIGGFLFGYDLGVISGVITMSNFIAVFGDQANELHKYDISCTVCYDNWRYILVLDENKSTGPFTMDLIEPHVALTQDRIDFDVSNLSLEKDYTHELGMRIDITQKPYSIELEAIVENIKNKRFLTLRPIDNNLNRRIAKMKDRGWTQMEGGLSVIPEPHKEYHAILVPLPRSSDLHAAICQKMRNIPGVQVKSIEEIRNPFLEEIYEGMKKIIKRQCPKTTSCEHPGLFHGTQGDGIDGITDDGYDDRFFNTGGHGAYFADDPLKSHNYTDKTSKTRVMYYNKVLLGESMVLNEPDKNLVCAPKNYHSIIGKHNQMTEYIIYRYGQALPCLKIVYTV